ncbi:CRISPR-associated helicase/endonuclease Cas3 [Hydrogenobacter hydrogenophilus]|uniref:CRISPR-associated helicase, Cas3 family n=1 Tax=Hydrogenobacter hydrogenophilus TaxID=35835 RepID=A0A285P1H7_9AQUI|nr:CRISPR-associated helicase/endonuclease Cas3 [Hydrogenobacter hydrogenophilus]SNZ15580.1 CRISPR-associated helicase, Cas3 family [Hydrogenobacter hydrogenophilus]
MEKSGIYSHPNVFIEDHINRCLELLDFYMDKNLFDENFIISAKVSTALHDFGKCTSYFQEYITGKRKKTKETEHAFISAVYTFHCMKKILEDRNYLIFSFISCKRHHTSPDSFIEEFLLDDENKEMLLKQLKSIDEEKTNIFINNLNLPDDLKEKIRLKKEEFQKKIPEYTEEFRALRSYIRKNQFEIKDFIRFQYLYSLILDSDKTEAGAKPFIPKRVEDIPLFVIFDYKKRKFSSQREIDKLRESAFQYVMSRDIDINSKIYSLTLPTGMGKTITGFAFALKLRQEIRNKKGITPRIIYSLPFVSIIDQNANILKEILNVQESGSLFLKHHHLSDITFDEFEFGVSRVLTEGWNSEIIITTFIQLFHTLISSSNSFSRRFNKLANSIILIDEVQALPSKYWHLLREFIKETSQTLGTYFIFMTATQPYLVDSAIEIANRYDFIDKLNRINVYIDLKEKTIEEFLSSLELNKEKTYLFIMNTISSSRELYKLLKKKVKEDVCYLSTYVLPCEREKRLKEIKEGKYRIVVSTQLVEAGVDIDFDVVYRDFAPLDALNQSAGRCNRNMEKQAGEFHIVRLVDKKSRDFAHYIYDSVLLNTTRQMLYGKSHLSEKEFILLVEDYFREVWRKISKDKSNEILEAVKSFRFSSNRSNRNSIRDFRLIEEEKYKSDVFVEFDEKATEVWKKAKEIIANLRKKNIDVFEAKEEFEKIKSSFYNYVISVDVRDNKLYEDKDLKIYFVSKDKIGQYYDKETGFIAKG